MSKNADAFFSSGLMAHNRSKNADAFFSYLASDGSQQVEER
jgi:hypothetical protein